MYYATATDECPPALLAVQELHGPAPYRNEEQEVHFRWRNSTSAHFTAPASRKDRGALKSPSLGRWFHHPPNRSHVIRSAPSCSGNT